MPVYNEIDNIAAILEIVAASLPGVTKEIVIVDDGSNDGTRDWLSGKFSPVGDESAISRSAAAASAISSDCAVYVIFHSRNKGKGGRDSDGGCALQPVRCW